MERPVINNTNTNGIRPAQKYDLERIGDLWVILMTYHAELDPRFAIPANGRLHYIRHINLALRDNNYRVLVAEERGQIIGYIIGYIAENPPMFPQTNYGFIADLCVIRSERRKGTGELLVTDICHWFRQRGMTNVQLNVAHHNEISQSFWRKIGCRDYLDHMWLKLDAEPNV